MAFSAFDGEISLSEGSDYLVVPLPLHPLGQDGDPDIAQHASEKHRRILESEHWLA
jgi:hypothetical protein